MSDLDHNSKVGTATDKLSQRRRALIKGSVVAIPAILTLRSGSALAATSVNCIKTFPLVPHPLAVSTTPDGWHRAGTDCRTLSNKVGDTTTTLAVYKDPTDTSNTPKWYELTTDNRNSVYFVDQNGNGMKDNSGTSWKIDTNSTCNVLVQVNAAGNPTGVVGAPETTSYSFAADSCYDSLHP